MKHLVLKMSKAFFLILLAMMIYHRAVSQWKAGIEQYIYTGIPLSDGIVPVWHIESPGKWYGELRYNYEEAQTLSLFAGKTFSGGNGLQYTIIPLLGYSTGRFTGVSFAANMEAEWKDLYLSSQSQFSIASKKKSENFFFSWTELGYNITRHFFTGVTIQYTGEAGQTDFEPGLLAGLSLKNISFPIYVFKPFHPGCYFILGMNYEFSLKKVKKNLIVITGLHLS